MYYSEIGDQDFYLSNLWVNRTGFDPYISASVNVTSVPAICERDQRWCNYCSGDAIIDRAKMQNCTLGVDINACAPTSTLYNSTLCASVGGVTRSKDLMAPGDALLQALNIDEIGQTHALDVLFQYAVVYTALAMVCAMLFHRDWHRRSTVTDIYVAIEKMMMMKQ